MLGTKVNESDDATRIIVIGVDGVDNSAVSRTIDRNIAGVEFIGVSTDEQALQFCKVSTAMQIGEKLTKGLGAGTRPDVGEKAAKGSSKEIPQALKGADMVLVACDMGGGIGAGATPVVTKIAKDMGVLIVGVVTKPPRLEAKTRMSNVLEGIENLKNSVDTLIVVPNDRLLGVVGRRTVMPDALKKTDEVLQQVMRDITDLINVPGLINSDFADVQIVMIDKGAVHISIGKAKSNDKAIKAIRQAVSSPLLGTTIEGASHVIINISGDISLTEASKAASYVQELAGDEVNIIFSAIYDENTQDKASITVIAAGLDEHGTNASVSNAMKGFTSDFKAKPSAVAAAIQTPHVTAPEAAATASSPYGRQGQGHTPSLNPPSSRSQGYDSPKYNPNQGHSTGSTQNPVPTPSQFFRSAASEEMQINIPDFLKNKR